MANSKQNILKRVCEYTVMIVAIGLAMAMFSAPAVIFYTFHNNATVGTVSISKLYDVITASCSSNNNTGINSVDSTSRNWSRSTDQCSPLQVQSRCHNHLKQVLKGKKLSQTNGSLSVQYTGRSLSQLESYMDLIISTGLTPRCNDLGVPLYCQFLFPPCQGETAPLRITRDQCRRLKDDYCRKEIDFLKSIQSLPIYKMFAYLNPNCSEFEDHQPRRNDHSNDLSTTHQNSTLEGRHFETNLTVSAACHPSFVRACESSVCLPSCTRAYYADQLSSEIEDATRILGSSVGTVGATLFILLAIWKRKEVFSFPTIFVFYQNAAQLVVGIVVLIPYVFGKGHLFCSHPDLVRTLHHPPTWFCSTSGVLFQFGITSALLLWLFQLTYITILITFPIFGAQKLKKWNNKIHMTAVPGAFALSIVAPIVVLATIGYQPSSFPASICFPGNFNASFYSIAVPCCVIMATGIVLMILIVRNIHKSFKSEVNTLKNRLSNTRSFFSAPEVKMIILSTLMLILGSTIMASFSLTVATEETKFQSITDFSKCQLHGYSSQCNEGDLHNLGVEMAIRSFTYIELGLVPLMNIFFILKISDFSKVKKNLLKTSKLKKGTSV